MLAIIKNDWNRLKEEKTYFFMSMFLTVCAVVAAVVLTNHTIVKTNVALVSEEKQLAVNDALSVTRMKTLPKLSEVAMARYDAAVVMKEGKVTKILSAKSEEEQQKIKAMLEHPASYQEDASKERQIGTNIIGYVMMFLFMQGVVYGKLFGHEKEKHLSERIVVSPVGFYPYLFGHSIFQFGLIFLPTFLVIAAANVMGVSEGLSLGAYAGVLAVLSVLATAYSMFLNSLFKESDTSTMIGNSSIILTTVLSGSFFSMLKEGSLLNKVLYILPQKDFLFFVNDLEKKQMTRSSYLELLYVILIATVFIIMAVKKTRREYVRCL